MVQNPPCWRASSWLFSHWDIKTKRPEPVKLDLSLFWCPSAGIIMSLPSSMADFVPCDRLLQKAYCELSINEAIDNLEELWIFELGSRLVIEGFSPPYKWSETKENICKKIPQRNVCVPLGWLQFLCSGPSIGSLRKHDLDGSENVIWKCNFACLQSFLNFSKSLHLQNVF